MRWSLCFHLVLLNVKRWGAAGGVQQLGSPSQGRAISGSVLSTCRQGQRSWLVSSRGDDGVVESGGVVERCSEWWGRQCSSEGLAVALYCRQWLKEQQQLGPYALLLQSVT